MKKTIEPTRLTKALLETADDMRHAGIFDQPAHAKITLRHLAAQQPLSEPMSAGEIRMIREQAHLSQAALARHLDLTVGFISQLERGVKQATGPTLVLLNLIRRRGFAAIFSKVDEQSPRV